MADTNDFEIVSYDKRIRNPKTSLTTRNNINQANNYVYTALADLTNKPECRELVFTMSDIMDGIDSMSARDYKDSMKRLKNTILERETLPEDVKIMLTKGVLELSKLRISTLREDKRTEAMIKMMEKQEKIETELRKSEESVTKRDVIKETRDIRKVVGATVLSGLTSTAVYSMGDAFSGIILDSVKFGLSLAYNPVGICGVTGVKEVTKPGKFWGTVTERIDTFEASWFLKNIPGGYGYPICGWWTSFVGGRLTDLVNYLENVGDQVLLSICIIIFTLLSVGLYKLFKCSKFGFTGVGFDGTTRKRRKSVRKRAQSSRKRKSVRKKAQSSRKRKSVRKKAQSSRKRKSVKKKVQTKRRRSISKKRKSRQRR